MWVSLPFYLTQNIIITFHIVFVKFKASGSFFLNTYLSSYVRKFYYLLLCIKAPRNKFWWWIIVEMKLFSSLLGSPRKKKFWYRTNEKKRKKKKIKRERPLDEKVINRLLYQAIGKTFSLMLEASSCFLQDDLKHLYVYSCSEDLRIIWYWWLVSATFF